MKRFFGVQRPCSAVGCSPRRLPEIPFDGNIGFLKLPPNIHLGEAAGVATNSKGNIFVYTRTGEDGTMGGSRFFTHGGSRLFEFDATGKYLREIGTGIYGFVFAQSVRVDAQDNIWTVDRGSNTIIKFDPAGRFLQVLSRKPESINPKVRPLVDKAPAAARGAAQCPARVSRAIASTARPTSRGMPRGTCSSPIPTPTRAS